MPDKFRPTVFNNQRTILTPAMLDDHPLAAEYIAYHNRQKYPRDFKAWIADRERRIDYAAERSRRLVRELAADPYCRSPIKPRRIK